MEIFRVGTEEGIQGKAAKLMCALVSPERLGLDEWLLLCLRQKKGFSRFRGVELKSPLKTTVLQNADVLQRTKSIILLDDSSQYS